MVHILRVSKQVAYAGTNHQDSSCQKMQANEAQQSGCYVVSLYFKSAHFNY
jgi:hypothetical protein